MRYLLLCILITTVQVVTFHSSSAQTVHMEGIKQVMRVNESTRIFDKTSGKRISYQEYDQLMRKDRYAYHLEPIFDEYGQASAYKLRPTTAEERETRRFDLGDPTMRPKVGEPMAEFVMKGIDDKVYRLTELKGHVIVLSFWISLKKPIWGPNQAKSFADALRPYQSKTDLISLGVLHESKDDISTLVAIETLPFIPIPDSYGFHQKFYVRAGPSFIVIDRTGRVAAYLEGFNYDQLQKVLRTLSQ
jgi:peroxiredoxin